MLSHRAVVELGTLDLVAVGDPGLAVLLCGSVLSLVVTAADVGMRARKRHHAEAATTPAPGAPA